MRRFWNYYGPLMNEADGGEGGGAGGGDSAESTALVVADGNALAVTDDDDLGTGADDSTALTLAEESAPAIRSDFQALDGNKPSKVTAEALQLLRTDPKYAELVKDIPKALAVRSRLYAQFPAGVKAFDEIARLQRQEKSLGGPKGIEEINKSLADMEQNDLWYADGDPRLIENMTQTPEAKAAFVKVMPHALAKLAKIAPQALAQMAPEINALYERVAPNASTARWATTFLNHLASKEIPFTLRMLAAYIPKENEAAIGELAKIEQFLADLKNFTSLAPEALAAESFDVSPSDKSADAERAKLEQEKREFELSKWKHTSDTDKAVMFKAEWDKQSKGLTISTIDKEDIEARFWDRLAMALKATPDFDDTLVSFAKNNDRNGYLSYIKGLHTKHMPRILEAEVKRRTGKTATAVATTTQARSASPGQAQVPEGFKLLKEKPDMADLDQTKRTVEMVRNRQGVLRKSVGGFPAGTKVQW